MSSCRCSYCGQPCDYPVRLSFSIGGRDRGSARVTILNLCAACSNSWCTDQTLRSGERHERITSPTARFERRRAG